MADRTIKPDDTHDLVLSNNDGSSKLELNEDQTVKITTGSDAGEDFTVNTTKLVVEGDTGNVGIGTAAATALLHIQAASDTDAFQRIHADFDDGGISKAYTAYASSGSVSAPQSTWAVGHAGTDNKFMIGYGADGWAAPTDSTRLTITSDGKVGIGETSPSHMLHVKNGASGYYTERLEHIHHANPAGLYISYTEYNAATADNDLFLNCVDSDGVRIRIDAKGNVENVSGDAIAAISDERLKENIADYTGGLSIINSLKPKTFTWKSGVERGMTGTRYGFIAQEVIAIEGYEENMNLARKGTSHESDSDAVKSLCDDGVIYKSQMSSMQCILISAIKELSTKITALENA